MSAQIILQNANVVTVDSEDSMYTSIAIEGERILALGTDEEMERLAGNDTYILDMEGKTITPGLVDSHNHTCEYGFSEMVLDLRYPAVTCIQDIVDKVREAAESKPKGAWIRGVGWDDALLDEKRPPTRQDLDPVSPDHPVILHAQTPVQVATPTRWIWLTQYTRQTMTGSCLTTRYHTRSGSWPGTTRSRSARRLSSGPRRPCSRWASPPRRRRAPRTL